MFIRLLRVFSRPIKSCKTTPAVAVTSRTRGGSRGFAGQSGGGRSDNSRSGGEKDDAPHAMRDSYQATSGNQYSAHLGCQDMLLGCAERLKKRGSQNSLSTTQWKIADLGSADGSNSIRTIEVFLDALNDKNRCSGTSDGYSSSTSTSTSTNVHIFFEEHPASDEANLTRTVRSWLETKAREKCETNITFDVLMKSFYESLFEANSIDFCMSYICLHWLDFPGGSHEIRSWKRLHTNDPSGGNDTGSDGYLRSDGFLQVNERTAPHEFKVMWKEELADRHLARFLALRARELKPKAELMVVMVSDPHEYWTPEQSIESPLLKAMKKCVAEGSLRKRVLERTIVPYYLRQPRDVLDALALAQRQESDHQEAPIHSLELVDIRQYETLTGGNDNNSNGHGDGMKGARDLFWAIHGGTVVNTGGATENEVSAIKNCLVETFDESYDPATGFVKGNFIASVFRKKN